MNAKGKYPNQRTIEIMSAPKSREAIKQRDPMSTGHYLFCDMDAMELASRIGINLVGEGSKMFLPLWVYFVKNMENYNMGYSPKDVNNRMGGNDKTLKAALMAMIKFGYLVPEFYDGHLTSKFKFYDTPYGKPISQVLPLYDQWLSEKKDGRGKWSREEKEKEEKLKNFL